MFKSFCSDVCGYQCYIVYTKRGTAVIKLKEFFTYKETAEYLTRRQSYPGYKVGSPVDQVAEPGEMWIEIKDVIEVSGGAYEDYQDDNRLPF